MSADTDRLIAHLRADLAEAAKPGLPQYVFPDSWASLDALAAAAEAAEAQVLAYDKIIDEKIGSVGDLGTTS